MKTNCGRSKARSPQAQQRLAQAQQAAASRPKSYAIVPYDGPNRTRRRPIYIECRGDAVVLQPENIVFTEADFDEPLGPGNPLAAAVRAAREQMLLQGSVDPQNAGEPYPLLLVRPAGIAAYDAALAAMKSWGSEFGYELINDDWQLKYPPPDPNLAKAVDPGRCSGPPGTCPLDRRRAEQVRQAAAERQLIVRRLASEAERQGGAGEGESPGFYSSKPSDRYASNNGGGSSGGWPRRPAVRGLAQAAKAAAEWIRQRRRRQSAAAARRSATVLTRHCRPACRVRRATIPAACAFRSWLWSANVNRGGVPVRDCRRRGRSAHAPGGPGMAGYGNGPTPAWTGQWLGMARKRNAAAFRVGSPGGVVGQRHAPAVREWLGLAWTGSDPRHGNGSGYGVANGMRVRQVRQSPAAWPDRRPEVSAAMEPVAAVASPVTEYQLRRRRQQFRASGNQRRCNPTASRLAVRRSGGSRSSRRLYQRPAQRRKSRPRRSPPPSDSVAMVPAAPLLPGE